jgi:hypothetical protein
LRLLIALVEHVGLDLDVNQEPSYKHTLLDKYAWPGTSLGGSRVGCFAFRRLMRMSLSPVGGRDCCFAGTVVVDDSKHRHDGAGASDFSVTEKVKAAGVREGDRTKGNRAHGKLQLPGKAFWGPIFHVFFARLVFPQLQNSLAVSWVGPVRIAALITRVNVEVKRADKLREGEENTLAGVAPQVLRQAEAFCIESERKALWNVLLDGERWIFAHFQRPGRNTKAAKNTVTVSTVRMFCTLPGFAGSRRGCPGN